MKLQILATICLLGAVAVASPRRRYQAGPSQRQAAAKIESLDDVQNVAAQFYDKHGSQYQTAVQSVAGKLQRAFQSGKSTAQRQKNIEQVLIYNADQFGISRNEARQMVTDQKDFIEDSMSRVEIAAFKQRLGQGLGAQLNEGISQIENKKVRDMVNDARKSVISSLELNENESVQDNLGNLWSFLNTKFDIEGEAQDVMDEFERKVKN